MEHGNDYSLDVAREAYIQSLFPDLVISILQERALREAAEERHRQTLDDAKVAFRSIYKYRERISELEQQVKYDDLTGLLEKSAWNTEVESMLMDGTHFGIIYIDLTNFKWVNDNISHNEGDRILASFAKSISEATRARSSGGHDSIRIDDMPGTNEDETWIGRLGGDEFALLIDLTPRNYIDITDEERLGKVIDRLSDATHNFLDTEPVLKAGGFNVAIGGTVKTEGDTLDSIVERAEYNMYKVKRDQHKDSRAER
jgi:GGDEF domain-containing protein